MIKPHFFLLYFIKTGSKIKSMTTYFIVVVNVLLSIYGHLGSDMPYLRIFVEDVFALLGALTVKRDVKSSR